MQIKEILGGKNYCLIPKRRELKGILGEKELSECEGWGESQWGLVQDIKKTYLRGTFLSIIKP